MRSMQQVFRRIDRVAIVMPARDEVDHVEAAIEALGTAIARVRGGVGVEVCVVDDGSTDGTGEAARRGLATIGIRHRLARSDVSSAARARRLGVRALTSAWHPAERAWLLSTDADSRVPEDWLVRHLAHAERGVLAVAGVVDLLDDDDSADLTARWRRDYGQTIADDGRHPHAHATNLGVRLDVYRAVGGYRQTTGAEDTDLWRRLRLAGVQPLADASIVVATSGRRTGRVADGFAHALATQYPVGGLEAAG